MESGNGQGKWLTYSMVVSGAQEKENTGKVHRKGQGGGRGVAGRRVCRDDPAPKGTRESTPEGSEWPSGKSLACFWSRGEVGQVREGQWGVGVRDPGCQLGLQRG